MLLADGDASSVGEDEHDAEQGLVALHSCNCTVVAAEVDAHLALGAWPRDQAARCGRGDGAVRAVTMLAEPVSRALAQLGSLQRWEDDEAQRGESAQAATKASSEAAKTQQEYTYARALVLRYLELEDQHEALFPALASAFKLTQQEVQRIQRAQQQHASETSLWGRTWSAGSRIVEAARAVASEASPSGAAGGGGAAAAGRGGNR